MMTRFYTSLTKVAVDSVGQMINVMVANFFNSCLIEESRIRIHAADQGFINNNNLRSDTRFFKDNLGKSIIVNQLPFTKWMMACPMLNSFLDEETYGKVQTFVSDAFKIDRGTYPVYELLCKINSKNVVAAVKDEKPSFSGEKKVGCRKTIKVLKDKGFHDELIREKIIDEENIDKAIDFIKSTGLFSTVYKSSVESFKKSYQQQGAAIETVLPHHHDDNPENANE